MQDNYNGLLVGFNDINSIVEKVTDVINNRDKYNEITANARNTVKERCELRDMLKLRVDMMNSLLLAKRGKG